MDCLSGQAAELQEAEGKTEKQRVSEYEECQILHHGYCVRQDLKTKFKMERFTLFVVWQLTKKT